MSDKKKSPDLQAEMENLWHKGTQQRESMADAITEWQDDGFGIFMHFSASTAFQGRYQGEELKRDLWGEWLMKRAEIPIPVYEEQLRRWNPDQFDAEEWADAVAASAGRYFFTTPIIWTGMSPAALAAQRGRRSRNTRRPWPCHTWRS